MIKKLIAMLLMLAVLCCAGLAETGDYTGEWTLTRGEASGVTVDTTAMGLEMTIVILEDGMCMMSAMGEEEIGEWTAINGGVAVTDAQGGTMAMFLNENGELTTDQGGATLIFTREEIIMPLPGLTAADFNGDWRFVYAKVMGQHVAAEDTSLDIRLQLADGKGKMEIISGGKSDVYDSYYVVEEVSWLGSVLYFLDVNTSGALTGEAISMVLFENGELTWLPSEGAEEVYYIFERVAE